MCECVCVCVCVKIGVSRVRDARRMLVIIRCRRRRCSRTTHDDGYTAELHDSSSGGTHSLRLGPQTLSLSLFLYVMRVCAVFLLLSVKCVFEEMERQRERERERCVRE